MHSLIYYKYMSFCNFACSRIPFQLKPAVTYSYREPVIR
jgi:hypothetical protein